jgi:hypothetical protein
MAIANSRSAGHEIAASVENEGLLSCSQDPFTGPYPERVKCSPTQIYFQMNVTFRVGHVITRPFRFK